MLSFFGKGDQKKQPGHGGPVVRRVITKKPIPPKPPANTTASTPSRPSTSSSSYKNGSSSTQSSRPKPVSSVKGKEKASQSRPTTTPVKRPIKRKVESTRIESESESESDSSEEDATDLFGSTKSKKAKMRIGLSATPRPLAGEEYVGKDRTLFRYRSDGEAGEWEGFMPGEEIVNGVRKGWENKGDDQQEGRVRSLLDKYAACTSCSHADSVAMADARLSAGRIRKARSTSVCRAAISRQRVSREVSYLFYYRSLESPLTIRFYLLNPTAAREYAPLRELRTTMQQILECELGARLYCIRCQADVQSIFLPRIDKYLVLFPILSISIVRPSPAFNPHHQLISPLPHLVVTHQEQLPSLPRR